MIQRCFTDVRHESTIVHVSNHHRNSMIQISSYEINNRHRNPRHRILMASWNRVQHDEARRRGANSFQHGLQERVWILYASSSIRAPMLREMLVVFVNEFLMLLCVLNEKWIVVLKKFPAVMWVGSCFYVAIFVNSVAMLWRVRTQFDEEKKRKGGWTPQLMPVMWIYKALILFWNSGNSNEM